EVGCDLFGRVGVRAKRGRDTSLPTGRQQIKVRVQLADRFAQAGCVHLNGNAGVRESARYPAVQVGQVFAGPVAELLDEVKVGDRIEVTAFGRPQDQREVVLV